MDLTPDEIVFWQWGVVKVNATLVWTWAVMILLAGASWLLGRGLRTDGTLTRGQNILEAVVSLILDQIREVSGQRPGPVLSFVGTLFLFVLVSNVLSIVPGYHAPTGSLSTTASLALCVFVAVPVFGIREHGLRGYLKQYAQPSLFILPFTILGELSRTLALALRLFGNMMSGTVIVALLLGLAPLLVPAIMQAFGLLIGVIQAYIFAVLAMVYIASATRAHDEVVATSERQRSTDG
ncbi:MAG: F0F1 ATP synthase subunit A [Gemmatimonadales bacterium]|nr:F0F1 ATP synthase subunit A [Gemmatimonadales bacterium]